MAASFEQPAPVDSGPPRASRAFSLRARLMLLVAAVLVPAILAAGLLIWKSYRDQRRLVETQIVETAQAMSLALDDPTPHFKRAA